MSARIFNPIRLLTTAMLFSGMAFAAQASQMETGAQAPVSPSTPAPLRPASLFQPGEPIAAGDLMAVSRAFGDWTMHCEMRLSTSRKICAIVVVPADGLQQDDRLLNAYRNKQYRTFLEAAVLARKCIINSGATSSYKATFSKAYIQHIPESEWLISIEDTPELIIPQPDHVRLFYSKGGRGPAKVGAKDLLESCLRMCPDHVQLQELRDGAAFYYVATSIRGIQARSRPWMRIRRAWPSSNSPFWSRSPKVARMLESEFKRARYSSPNELYVDSLITVFATHLLRSYSQLGQRGVPHKQGGLSPKIMMRVLDYIHAHMSKKISLVDLASIAGFSPSHFTRAFRQSTGLAPHEFVLGLRLREVERLASNTEIPLSEVARLTGFSSQSHMTATMHQKWLVTPGEIRRDGLRR